MKYSPKHPAPTIFENETRMPFFPISSATTEYNETGTWRYLRPRYIESIPSCQNSCPTSNDIETWIRLFEKGKLEEAWEAATLENPFPSIMGRVCFNPCMNGCNRREMGGTVGIRMLEKELGDVAGEKLPAPKPFFPSTGKKVAVIGSGPAGLACAYHLSRLGHKVTVFEREKKAGGMLRYGIPEYRLPRNIIDREIEKLWEMGIEFKLATPIKDAVQTQNLRTDFNAIFIAIGAQKSRLLQIPGERISGVMSGLSFLKKIGNGEKVPVGKKVVVVGGGNTAIDTARVAKHLGAEVKILYRRSKAEMPAFEEEILHVEKDGVVIETLVAPKGILIKENKANAIICQKMKLDEPDESGRRGVTPIEGEEITFDADTIFTAIGEEMEISIIPSALHIDNASLKVNSTGQTEWKNVFAGGDMISQPRTVVDALGAGKRSAIAIDCYLRGEKIEDISNEISSPETNAFFMWRYLKHRTGKNSFCATTSELTKLPKIIKFEDLNPVYFTYSAPNDSDVKGELARCFHCGRCTECDNCYIYCPDVAIAKKEGGFEIDYFFCKGCGVCAKECPRRAMDMIEEPTEINENAND